MSKLLRFLLLAALVIPVSCSRKEPAPETKSGRVSATAAYERYFGPAPTTDKGTCFAFLIYFPSAVEPGKVVPFPFFTFDQPSIKKVAVERLLGGMEVPGYRGEFVNPFPAGSHLISVTENKGMVSLEMSNPASRRRTIPAAGRDALSLTLGQFEGVKGVEVVIDGARLRLKNPGDAVVKEPGPPRLLSVAASRDRGGKDVEDVSVLFDRPLEIRELKLTDPDGSPFQGDMYHSVFDMAAVLKPRNPSQFRAGLRIKVRWKVVDRKGREGTGEKVYPLELHEH